MKSTEHCDLLDHMQILFHCIPQGQTELRELRKCHIAVFGLSDLKIQRQKKIALIVPPQY